MSCLLSKALRRISLKYLFLQGANLSKIIASIQIIQEVENICLDASQHNFSHNAVILLIAIVEKV